MKKQIFGQCDKCIGITPCKILKDGSIVCEYCHDEVKRPELKHGAVEVEGTFREQPA